MFNKFQSKYMWEVFNKWLPAHWGGNQVYHVVQVQSPVLYQDCSCYYTQMPPVLKSWAQEWRDSSGQAGDRVRRRPEMRILGDPGFWHFQRWAICNTPSSSIPPVLSLCIREGQLSSLSPLPPGSSYCAWLWHFSSLPSCLSPLPAWSPVRTGTSSSLWGREAWPYRSNELMMPTRPSQSKGSWVFTAMDPLPELP